MMARLESWSYWSRALLFALIAFFITAIVERVDVFRSVDYDLSDAHGRVFAPKVNFEDMVVIDVDEESIAQLQPKLGAWPYDREVYALVVNWLKRSGVRAGTGAGSRRKIHERINTTRWGRGTAIRRLR